jgi:hypothetical protein
VGVDKKKVKQEMYKCMLSISGTNKKNKAL